VECGETHVYGSSVAGDVVLLTTLTSLRMRIATAGTPMIHASEVAALEEANEGLWAAWESGAANVLGGFAVVEGSQGFYVSGPVPHDRGRPWPAPGRRRTKSHKY
jgi:hypothetical protein